MPTREYCPHCGALVIKREPPSVKLLSPREVEVLCGVILGKTIKGIAHELGLRTETARKCYDKGRTKLRVRTLYELLTYREHE